MMIKKIKIAEKDLDRWYANLFFRQKLILMEKYKIEDWFELILEEKKKIYDREKK